MLCAVLVVVEIATVLLQNDMFSSHSFSHGSPVKSSKTPHFKLLDPKLGRAGQARAPKRLASSARTVVQVAIKPESKMTTAAKGQ